MLCMLFCAFQYFLNLFTIRCRAAERVVRIADNVGSSSKVELVVPRGQVYFESEESLEASFMLQEN